MTGCNYSVTAAQKQPFNEVDDIMETNIKDSSNEAVASLALMRRAKHWFLVRRPSRTSTGQQPDCWGFSLSAAQVGTCCDANVGVCVQA